MRLIAPLSPETTKLLWRVCRQSNRFAIRQRAHCILLSAQGLSIGQLMQIFDGVRLKFAMSNYAYYDSTKSSHLDKQSAVSALEEDF